MESGQKKTLIVLRTLADACCQIVWHWPPLAIAEKIEFLTSEGSPFPLRGLLRVTSRSAWMPEIVCDIESTRGSLSRLEGHSSTVPQPLDAKCLSIDNDVESTVISLEPSRAVSRELGAPYGGG